MKGTLRLALVVLAFAFVIIGHFIHEQEASSPSQPAEPSTTDSIEKTPAPQETNKPKAVVGLRERLRASTQTQMAEESSLIQAANDDQHGGAKTQAAGGRNDPSLDDNIYDKPLDILIARFENGYWTIQGDILVRDHKLLRGYGGDEVKLFVIERPQLWERGVVPYEIDPRLDAKPIQRALAELNELTNVTFRPHEGESDYLFFKYSPEDACYSYVGRQGGEQEVVLHGGCKKGQIMHELLHAVGFVHEHSREDRDQYIWIHWNQIEPYRLNQFQKLAKEISNPAGVDFDFGSILLYPSDAFSANGESTITRTDGSRFEANRESLSTLDIVRVNALYP